MNSPFKFLDSFTKEDKDIFFGREQETEELYHKVFESKILLVYGISGTGKSSLIQCGLGNKFNESDWLPISIRRGSNINESLSKAVNSKQLSVSSNQSIEDSKQLSVNSNQSSVSGNQSATSNDKPQTTNDKQLKRSLHSLYLDHFKPIYLIFDQFEELFIFGSQSEKEEFIQTVKKISESDLNVKFLFVIREEYLANITEFEKLIPEFLENRIRIEKMQRKNAVQCIEEPCRVYGIEVEKGFSELLLDKLSPSSNEIELTYLQVFLDKIFRSVTQTPTLSPSHSLTFPLSILSQLGDVRDLLGSFLEEQIASLDEPDSALAILKSFVSIKGTKRQINETEINEHCKTIGFNLNYETYKKQILHFVNIRILRDKDENQRYELRHDALAAKIYEKITLVEKELMEVRQFIENAFANFEKRGVLLTPEDLKYIAPYENKLFLPENLSDFILKSKRKIEKIRRRKRILYTVSTTVIIIALVWYAVSNYYARKEAELQARISKSKELANMAIQYLETDPTYAYTLGEAAWKIYPTTEAEKILLNTYYREDFYNTFKGNTSQAYLESYHDIVISDSGKYILTTNTENNDIYLSNYKGELFTILIDNKERLLINSMKFLGEEFIYAEFFNDSTFKIWDIKGKLLVNDTIKLYKEREIRFIKDKIYFATTNFIKIFDKAGKMLNNIKLVTPAFDIVLSDNYIVFATQNAIHYYDIKTDKLLNKMPLERITNKEQFENEKIKNKYVAIDSCVYFDNKNNKLFTEEQLDKISFLKLYEIDDNDNLYVLIDSILYSINIKSDKIKNLKIPNYYVSFELNKNIILLTSKESIDNYSACYCSFYNSNLNLITKTFIKQPYYVLDESTLFNNNNIYIYEPSLKETELINTVNNTTNNLKGKLITCSKNAERLLTFNSDTFLIYNNSAKLINFFVVKNIQKINAIFSKDGKYILINNEIYSNDGVKLFELDKKIKIISQLYDNYYFTENASKKEIRKINFDKISNFKINKPNEEIVLDEFGQPIVNEYDYKPFFYNNIKDSSIISILHREGEIYKWSYDGMLLAYNKLPFELGSINKICRTGKYFTNVSLNDDDLVSSKIIIFSTSDLKTVFQIDSILEAGIEFVDNDTILAHIYYRNILFNLDYSFKLHELDSIHINSSNSVYVPEVQIADNKIIGKNESGYLIYDFRTKQKEVIPFGKTYSLINNVDRYEFFAKRLLFYNKNNHLYFERDLSYNTLKILNNNLKELITIKTNGYFEVDKIHLINNTIFFNSNRINYFYKYSGNYFELIPLRLPDFFIEGYSLSTFNKETELFLEKDPQIGFELTHVFPENSRFICIYEGKQNYILKDGTELLSIESSYKNDYTDFNNIVFWDNVNYRIRTMSLNPDEIIKRIRINKEFGEIYQLTEKEKQKLGITEP